MLEIRNTDVYGFRESLIRSGNSTRTGIPLNNKKIFEPINRSMERGKRLGTKPVGSGHPNYLKGIIVQFDLKYSLYITKQLQRYHWFEIIASQSTMYTLTSHKSIWKSCNKYVKGEIIDIINKLLEEYNEMPNDHPSRYIKFMQIVSNLPCGFEQWMGITTNYLQLKTIYQQRKTHKLKEDYSYLINWMESLPYFKELVIGEENVNN